MFRNGLRSFSLPVRLAFSVLFSSVLVAGLTGGLVSLGIGYFEKARSLAQWESDVTRFADILESPVSNFELDNTVELTRVFVQSHELTVGAEVWHAEGLRFAAIGQEASEPQKKGLKTIAFPIPRAKEGRKIGILKTVRKSVSQQDFLFEKMQFVLTGVLAISVLVALFIHRQVSQQLAEPIATLSRQVSGYQLHREKITALVSGASEVILLSQAFQNMADRIRNLAITDPVTQLYNRNYLELLMKQAAGGSRCGLILLDLDHFKSVNDIYGHDVGDQLLKVIAERIQHLLPVNASLSRMGGDEFSIWVTKENRVTWFECLCHKITQTFLAPISLSNGAVVHIKASGGFALYPKDVSHPSQLLKAADLALYSAKAKRQSRIERYTHHLRAAAKEWAEISNTLRVAMADGSITFNFQAIEDVPNGVVWGYEMLLRLDNGRGSHFNPERVLQIALQTDALLDLTLHTFRCGIDFLLADKSNAHVTINLSPKQLALIDTARLHAMLGELPLSIRLRLVIEITEQALMDEESIRESVNALRAAGCKLALDDFGTGYASFICLSRFPLYIVKLDKSLTEGVLKNDRDRVLLESIVSVAKRMKILVLVEGVENVEHMALLRSLGCQFAQGYYIGKPLPEACLHERIAMNEQSYSSIDTKR